MLWPKLLKYSGKVVLGDERILNLCKKVHKKFAG